MRYPVLSVRNSVQLGTLDVDVLIRGVEIGVSDGGNSARRR